MIYIIYLGSIKKIEHIQKFTNIIPSANAQML